MCPRKQDHNKTSDSSKEKTDNLHETFSPVQLKAPTPHKQGNLTGSARKLKDGAADLHNLLHKWNNLNVEGANVISEIANIKVECILRQQEESDWSSDSLLPASLEPLCDKLQTILQKLRKLITKMTGTLEMVKGVRQLEVYKKATDEETSHVLFQTWDIGQFETTIEEIHLMYSRELLLKETLAETVCHARDRSSVMFHSAAWVHQPYIEDRAKLLLESLLLETGHK